MNTIKHDHSQGLIDFAERFAREAHESIDQRRKYTNDPYIVHPTAVAHLVASVTDSCEMIAAAYLHDVVEDTPVTLDDLVDAGFGRSIACLVDELTDVSKPEDGNREKRKAIDRAHTAKVSIRAKTIKLADLIDNSHTITLYDSGFAEIYMREKLLLLDVLKDGDKTLYAQASKIVSDYYSPESLRAG